MSGSAFVRLYRRAMGQALTPCGFQRKGSDFWWVRNGLLHAVVLHRSNPWSFTGEFAVQPLACPFSTFILDFGDRVDWIEPGRTSWWETSSHDSMELGVGSYVDTVVRYVVPWLDRFQTCRNFVETDLRQRWGVRKLDGPRQSKDAMLLGVAALVADMPEAAKQYLEFARNEYLRFVRPDSPPWDREDLDLMQGYLTLLEQGNWEGIRAKLAEGEAFTREHIGLPPANGATTAR